MYLMHTHLEPYGQAAKSEVFLRTPIYYCTAENTTQGLQNVPPTLEYEAKKVYKNSQHLDCVRCSVEFTASLFVDVVTGKRALLEEADSLEVVFRVATETLPT